MDQQARQINGHQADTNPPVASDAAPQHADTARRRLLKAGLIGAPLLVTLRSRPAYSLQSLGSAGIPYGMYDFDGDPVDSSGNKLTDPTRRAGN